MSSCSPFSREKYIEVLFFARKAPQNTERVPPGHPIRLLKSNKFNMAAILVKRSIASSLLKVLPSTRPCGPFYTTILIVVTLKFCTISIIFDFSWGYFILSPREIESNAYAKFWSSSKEYYCILWITSKVNLSLQGGQAPDKFKCAVIKPLLKKERSQS